MIAVIQATERKPYGELKRTRIMTFEVAGYSDAQRLLKELRKVTKSKLKLLEVR